MEHYVREEQGYHIVTLTGEIDLETSPQARQILLETVPQSTKLLIEMASVTYIDSSGIATLVEAFQRAKKNGGQVAFICLNPAVVRVLTLARLDKVFTIHADIESAIHAEP
ncbi:MAG: STAS domain-containing protein [Nitrospirota bacterium]|nr:STAS domain-containing protein [Nitrospirota bacterium]